MLLSKMKICESFLLVCMCLFLSKCKGVEVGYDTAPKCIRLECPQYTVIHSEQDYEIRKYSPSTWISSPKIATGSYKEGAAKGFKILRSYIQGNNKEQAKINMTAPVLIDVENSTYTVYFYLPRFYKNSPPQPNSDQIKPVIIPPHYFAAVRRFDGLINDETIKTAIDALKKTLANTGFHLAAAQNQFTVAGYNSPFQLKDRVNEVILWFGEA